MNAKKRLYEQIMKKIAGNVKAILESVDIPENAQDSHEFERDQAIELCLFDLETSGGAYLDWGEVGDMYKNIRTKELAKEVAWKFKDKGYYVYYQGCGKGLKHIPAGTPVAIRITKRPVPLSEFDSEFE